MSEYAEIKKDFQLQMFFEDARTLPEFSTVPKELRERWTRKFWKAKGPITLKGPRLINKFKLGADPEFIFYNSAEGIFVHASTLNLKAGLAIGADNNGRLTEFRPEPSRFALEVVASLYAEMRLLCEINPQTIQYNWLTGPFHGRDGLGGHVHFGRWYGHRNEEVAALDEIARLLYNAGTVPREEHRLRQSGTPYGRYGDIRAQKHGYEYRAFCSWLATPALAHLYLTLSKLAVYQPKLLISMYSKIKADAVHALRSLKALLAYYKDVDDDARLALIAFDRSVVPVKTSADFKENWGLVGLSTSGVKSIEKKVLPPTVIPTNADIRVVYEIIYNNILPSSYKSNPSCLLEFPNGYIPFQYITETLRTPGLGELVWDIAQMPVPGIKNIECVESLGRTGTLNIVVPYDLYIETYKRFRKKGYVYGHRKIGLSYSHEPSLSFSSGLLEKQTAPILRKILLEGCFPFVKLGQVDSPWKGIILPKKKASRVLFSG